jgi:GT2 family glycosyltransferase
VKRSLLERHGLFEEKMRYHEDLELSERLSHHGLRVIYNPAALGHHWHVLTEDEFLGVARREARALVVWSRKAPRLFPVLADFGFEPALSAGARLKSLIRAAVVNRATIPFWAAVARRCPASLDPLALKVYLQIYQSELRNCLLRELRI